MNGRNKGHAIGRGVGCILSAGFILLVFFNWHAPDWAQFLGGMLILATTVGFCGAVGELLYVIITTGRQVRQWRKLNG